MTFYRLISASDGNLIVCLCTMTQSDQKLPTGRRVSYSPVGYEYNVYDLCLLATIMMELLGALGHDNYETTMCFGTTKTRLLCALATTITRQFVLLATIITRLLSVIINDGCL